MSLLKLDNITKRYGRSAALTGLNLAVPAGSRTAIVGPSGSGKTTLLRLIAGFEAPDQGRIALGDKVLADGVTAVPAHRRGIGYVAQEGALFPHLTLAANIGFGIDRNSPNRQARILELMQQVGLAPAMRDRRPHQLSGGQQQRVALARAMARQPRLMLLDEPFSALDAGLREAMRDMVGDVLSTAGITTILVTHDQAEALSFADHLAVLRDGVVVQAGPPQDLYLRPTDAQTARFLGDAIILQASLEDGFAHTILGSVPADAVARRGNATIMLRPEQLELVPVAPGPSATTSLGRIVGRSFRGSTWRLLIEHLPASSVGLRFPSLALETSSIFTLETPSLTPLEIGATVQIQIVGTAHILA
ncbi:ABC transporter ATP-binding protein [uncultured Devosia sp.]|uniref:ABC transporter ATP-binding protein n=1 Tax=uncultured Devosia sp. TaxID=211434 RepID=UPI0035CAAA68